MTSVSIVRSHTSTETVEVEFPLFFEIADEVDGGRHSWTTSYRIAADGMCLAVTERWSVGAHRRQEIELRQIDLGRALATFLDRPEYCPIEAQVFHDRLDELLMKIRAVLPT